MPTRWRATSDSGVSLAAADAVVERLRAAVESTRTPRSWPASAGSPGSSRSTTTACSPPRPTASGRSSSSPGKAGRLRDAGRRPRRALRQRRADDGRRAALLPRLRRARPARPRPGRRARRGRRRRLPRGRLRDPRRRDRRDARRLPRGGARLRRHVRRPRRARAAHRRLAGGGRRRRARPPLVRACTRTASRSCGGCSATATSTPISSSRRPRLYLDDDPPLCASAATCARSRTSPAAASPETSRACCRTGLGARDRSRGAGSGPRCSAGSTSRAFPRRSSAASSTSASATAPSFRPPDADASGLAGDRPRRGRGRRRRLRGPLIGVLVSGRGHEPPGADRRRASRRAPLRQQRARRPARSSAARARGDPDGRLRARGLRDRASRDLAMADWLASRRRPLVVCAGLHAPAHAGVPRALPGRGHQRPPVAPARLPRPHAVEDALAAGRRRDRRRPCTSSTTGIDTGAGDPAGARCRSSPATRSRRSHARMHEVEHRLLPAAARLLAGDYARLAVIARALLSVYDKTGLDELRARPHRARRRARRERRHGDVLERARPRRRPASTTLTEFPELLGGRVKTLHPTIHAGDPRPARPRGRHGRARRARRSSRSTSSASTSTRSSRSRRRKDVARGGRGRDDRHRRARDAARGREELRPRRRRVCSTDQLRLGARRAAGAAATSRWRPAARSPPRRSPTPRPTRPRSRAGSRTARRSPDRLVVSLDKVARPRYGENPHQRAAYYAEAGARAPPALARRAARAAGSSPSTT